MRGQLGPHLVPGNSAAARRCARARKPPPIILWSIGIFTCLLFLGAAAMLAVGYLNPYGTIGLSILGVGAVVYFGAIVFLVLSCLWVERKYPGMQPLSFKFYTRKPQRPTPTAFVNPNISGQTPQTPIYRIHSEIASNITNVSDIEEITENVPSGPRDPTQNKIDKQNGNDLPEEVSSPDHDNQSTAQQSLQDEGSEDATKDHVPEAITITEASNQEGDTSAITLENGAIKDKSNPQNDNKTTNTAVQNENISQNNQKEYRLAKTSSAEKEGKVQQKNHQLELPKEDYSCPQNSTPASSNIKESGPETQGSKTPDTTQQSRKLLENNSSHIAVAPSIFTSQGDRTTMHQQKEKHKVDVPALSSTREQQNIQKQSPSVQQTQHNTSQTVNTETDRIFKKDKNAKNISQTDNLQRQPAVRVKKQSRKIQDISPEKMMGLPPTDSSSLASNKQDTVLQTPKADKSIDLEVLPKATPINERKRVHFQEYHVQGVQPSKNLVKDNSRVSSVADANNALQFKHDGRHGQQNKSQTNDVSATTANFAQIPDSQDVLPKSTKNLEAPKKPKKVESPERTKKNDSPDRAKKPESPRRERKPESPDRAKKPGSPRRERKPESPERATRPESPERGRKLRIDHKLSHSPPNVRKIVSSSSSPPTRQHQNISPKAHRKNDNLIAMTNLSSSKEELYRKQNYHSSPSSQSSDLPSSTSSSSSPPRHHMRSPDLSPKLPKHQFHSSENADFNSSARKEKRHDRHSQQSSQSSYSSDVPSSTSSSPQRHRRNDPDISSKAQRQKDKPTGSSGFPSNTKIDDLNKSLSQQSSQSNDVTLSPTMSPTKLLQHKLERADLNKSTRSPHTREPLIQTFGATSEYKHQTKQQHLDKPRISSHPRELSPTAARTSPHSNKRFPANPRKDQT